MLRRPRPVTSLAFALALALLAGSGGLPAPAQAITVPPTTSTGTLPFLDSFSSGTRAWTSVTDGSGRILRIAGYNGAGVRLSVPKGSGNRAYLRYDITAGTMGLYARAYVRVRSAACDLNAGWSYGNVPFLRFFDTAGNRVVGLYATKRPCTTGPHQLWLQHSYGNYYPTAGRISFGATGWTKLELSATVTTPGRSIVTLSVGGTPIYTTSLAANGALPFGSVVIGNEHLGQPAVLDVDSVWLKAIAGVPAAAPDPCSGGDGTTGATVVRGTILRSDTFEDYSLAGWAVTLGGNGTAVISGGRSHSPTCALRLASSTTIRTRATLSTALPRGTVGASAEGWFLAERASSTNIPYLRFFGSIRAADVFRQTSTGRLWLGIGRPGTTGYRAYDLGVRAPLGSWHHVALHVNASSGRVQVWVDGTLRKSGRWTLGVSAISRVQVGNEVARQSSALWVDDLVVLRD